MVRTLARVVPNGGSGATSRGTTTNIIGSVTTSFLWLTMLLFLITAGVAESAPASPVDAGRGVAPAKNEAIRATARKKDKPNKVAGYLRDFVSGQTAQQVVDAADEETIVPSQSYTSIQTTEDGTKVLVEFVGSDIVQLQAALEASPVVTVKSCKGYICSGSIVIEEMEAFVESTPEILQVSPVLMIIGVGSVTGEGVEATNADILLDSPFDLAGDGVTIGILSDSFNCLSGRDVETDDLPDSYLILKELEDCSGGTDEGRAMMQLIHDISPHSTLAFHTASGGSPAFAEGMEALADAGCDVIVDDVGYGTQPFFQDGLLAQTAGEIVSKYGIPYFTAAGNQARSSWEGTFKNSGVRGINGGWLHEFPDGTVYQSLLYEPTPNLSPATLVFQWDEPFLSVDGEHGSASDVDVHIYELQASGELVLITSFLDFNVDKDPIEFGSLPVVTETVYYISLELFEGPEPNLMKWIAFDNRPQIIEFDTLSGTSFGQQNSAFTAAIGAANYFNTPRFGVDPALQTDYSSAGEVPILFDTKGKRLKFKDIEYRRTPLVVAPDFTLTTFFGENNRFSGTSAAAPHVAGIVGLLLEFDDSLSPCDIYEALAESAGDMDDIATRPYDIGFDFGTGYGFVDAVGALIYVDFELDGGRSKKKKGKKNKKKSIKKHGCPYTGPTFLLEDDRTDVANENLRTNYDEDDGGKDGPPKASLVATASIVGATLVLTLAKRRCFRRGGGEGEKNNKKNKHSNNGKSSSRTIKTIKRKGRRDDSSSSEEDEEEEKEERDLETVSSQSSNDGASNIPKRKGVKTPTKKKGNIVIDSSSSAEDDGEEEEDEVEDDDSGENGLNGSANDAKNTKEGRVHRDGGRGRRSQKPHSIIESLFVTYNDNDNSDGDDSSFGNKHVAHPDYEFEAVHHCD